IGQGGRQLRPVDGKRPGTLGLLGQPDLRSQLFEECFDVFDGRHGFTSILNKLAARAEGAQAVRKRSQWAPTSSSNCARPCGKWAALSFATRAAWTAPSFWPSPTKCSGIGRSA